jgi:acetate kinase
MKILSVNAGSSSLKFQMYEMPEEKVLISGVFERIGIGNSFYTIKLNGEKIKKEREISNHEEAVKILTEELLENKVVSSLDEIEAIGHRMVHGGDKYPNSTIIDDGVIELAESLLDLAPIHIPANLTGVRAFQKIIPNATAVAVFDTSFHQTLPKEAYIYPVPYEWYEKYGVRKYGFHGTSHKYVSMRMNEILGRTDTKIITCHIGSGGSVSAVLNGKSIDTSLGFTPNAGIVMGTRSGDIDASIIPYIMKKANLTVSEVDNILNKKSGLLGISKKYSDSRDIEEGIKNGDELCKLAQDIYVRRIVEYIAKYYVLLGGCDAIVMTAGVGENSIPTRKQILDKLSVLGVQIDEERNNIRGEEQLITKDTSKIPVWVIPTDEELMIARDTYELAK